MAALVCCLLAHHVTAGGTETQQVEEPQDQKGWFSRLWRSDRSEDEPLSEYNLKQPDGSPAIPRLIEQLDLEGWVSRLWEPVASEGGLLDQDDIEDVVLVLHRRDASPGDKILPAGSRGLAIFSLDEQGRYRLTAMAEGVLPCVECLGTLNRDPMGNPFDIEIEDRRLTVGWISNDDGLIAVRLTFAWDEERQTYALVADDVARAGRTREVEIRRIRDFVSGRETMNGETHPIEPRFIPMEAVKAEDYR